MSEPQTRNKRRTEMGTVLSAKVAKTIVVGIERVKPHPRYEKYIRHRIKCCAYDEKGEAKVGDVVVIASTRPVSKTKRWRLLRIVRAANVS